jgi:hypothetical protein
MVDIVVGDVGLGKGLGAGDAERAFLASPSRKRGSRATMEILGIWIPAFRRNDG